MMIDEAIRHCLEVADYDCYNDKQMKCAEEHRQLAEWLKDYKRLLAKESGNLRCRTCTHFDDNDSDECGKCYEYSRWEGDVDG